MLKDKVEKALEKIRPNLEADGGNITLIYADDTTGKVVVRLMGACMGCPMSTFTLKNMVEKIIKEEVPEVTSVEAE